MITLDEPFTYSHAQCMYEGGLNRFIYVAGHVVASKMGKDPWKYTYPKSQNIEDIKAQTKKVDDWAKGQLNRREEELKKRDEQNIAVIDAAIARGKK